MAKGLSNYEDGREVPGPGAGRAARPRWCSTSRRRTSSTPRRKASSANSGGDCEATGASTNTPATQAPEAVADTRVDRNGDEVDLAPWRHRRRTTSTGTSAPAVRTVKIEEAGTYRLNVESDESDFAVAIGKNPEEDNDEARGDRRRASPSVGLVLGLLFFCSACAARRIVAATADIRDRAPGPCRDGPDRSARYAGAAPPPPPSDPPPSAGTGDRSGFRPRHLVAAFAPPTSAPPPARSRRRADRAAAGCADRPCHRHRPAAPRHTPAEHLRALPTCRRRCRAAGASQPEPEEPTTTSASARGGA